MSRRNRNTAAKNTNNTILDVQVEKPKQANARGWWGELGESVDQMLLAANARVELESAAINDSVEV